MRKTTRLLRVRMVIRTLALAAFLVLPTGLFLKLDPLAALSLWSIVLMGATVVWGRWFCGWLCPVGVYHHLMSRLFSRWRREKSVTNRYEHAERLKYYLLAFLIACLIGGWDALGWLDPLCLLYRGLGVAQATEIYQNVGALVPASFSDSLSTDTLALGPDAATRPPRLVLWGSFLTLALLLVTTAMNFLQARFWCRSLCPLGALLGVVARRPLVALELSSTSCSGCQACGRVCPGGARPHVSQGWRSSECFSCRSCAQLCPSKAIDFRSRFGKRE